MLTYHITYHITYYITYPELERKAIDDNRILLSVKIFQRAYWLYTGDTLSRSILGFIRVTHCRVVYLAFNRKHSYADLVNSSGAGHSERLFVVYTFGKGVINEIMLYRYNLTRIRIV